MSNRWNRWSRLAADLVNEPCWSMRDFRHDHCANCDICGKECLYASFLGAIPFVPIENVGKAFEALIEGVKLPKKVKE